MLEKFVVCHPAATREICAMAHFDQPTHVTAITQAARAIRVITAVKSVLFPSLVIFATLSMWYENITFLILTVVVSLSAVITTSFFGTIRNPDALRHFWCYCSNVGAILDMDLGELLSDDGPAKARLRSEDFLSNLASSVVNVPAKDDPDALNRLQDKHRIFKILNLTKKSSADYVREAEEQAVS